MRSLPDRPIQPLSLAQGIRLRDRRRNGAVGQRRRCFKLGLDVELRNVAVAIQCERGGIGPAQKLSLQQLISWVKQKVGQGHAVYTVYECCGFGYTLHEQLVDAGATSFLTTPMRLNLERRRKNDRMDARELCVRLSRYVDGQRDELRAIRIPSRVEQQRRELGRQRRTSAVQLCVHVQSCLVGPAFQQRQCVGVHDTLEDLELFAAGLFHYL